MRASAERLELALARLPGDEPGARDALRNARSRRAFAWRAYLAARAGDDEGSREILTGALGVEGPVNTPHLAALAAVRAETESEPDAEVDRIPCAVFAWEGVAAVEAFAPSHGSNLDALAGALKARCTAAAIDAALPAPERTSLRRALDAVHESLFARFPRPEGTLWTAHAITVTQRSTDAFLHIDYIAPPHTVAQVRALAGRRHAAALGRHLAVLDAQAPRIGRAWCLMARAAGREVDERTCIARARAAAISAAHDWLQGVLMEPDCPL